MNCCFETMIDCCEELTTTSEAFIRALTKVSGMTIVGMKKNKRCAFIINRRLNHE